MARDRKPVEGKELSGNPSKDSDLGDAPKSRTGRPTPPANLKGEAYAEWCRVVDFLATTGHIEKIDYAGLVVYCTAWQTYDQARAQVEQFGPTVVGRDGGLVRNPACVVMNDASKIMLAYGVKFGLSPKDRQNLGMKSSPDPGSGLEGALRDL